MAKVNINRLIRIESAGNPNAVSEDDAVGLGQITNIALKEYNERHEEKYSLEMMTDPKLNKRVASWYVNDRIPKMLKYYGLPDTVENRLIAYNGGIQRAIDKSKGKAIPKETQDYIERYNKAKPLLTPDDSKRKVADVVADETNEEVMTMAQNEKKGDWMTVPEIKDKQKNRGKEIDDAVKNALGSTETEVDPWDNMNMGKGQAREYVNTLVVKGTKLLHSPNTRENVIRVLSKGNPIENVANLTSTVMHRLDVYSQKTGKNIPDAMKVVVAQNIMEQVVEIGHASGFAPLDESEQKAALSQSVQTYVSNEIQKGRIDPKALAEENGKYIANMSDEERTQLNGELEDINDVALASVEKYGPGISGAQMSTGGQMQQPTTPQQPMSILGMEEGDSYGA